MVRDLVDVQALIESGENLTLAMADAPRRDSGFSPLTLAWVLRDFDVLSLAKATNLDRETSDRLDAFRIALIAQLITL